MKINGCCGAIVVVVVVVAQIVNGVVTADEFSIRTVLGTGMDQINQSDDPQKINIGNPFGVEVGPDAALYMTEVTNHRVWRYDPQTKDLRVVAGVGVAGYDGDGGSATEAKLNEPYEVRFDQDGHLFFVEMRNHIVRRIDSKTGVITTVAGTGEAGFGGDGGPAIKAQLNRPHSIALDAAGNLFIADIGNHRIRRVDRQTGLISSIAGTGDREGPVDLQPTKGQPVLGPRALYIVESTLWVALREGNSIWRIDLSRRPWTWQHVAGTGQKGFSGDGGLAKLATFNGPKGITVGPKGNVYVVDTENQVIRCIHLQDATITTIAGRGPDFRGFAGEGVSARQASMGRPHGVGVDARGRVYVGDSENHRVRVIEPQAGIR